MKSLTGKCASVRGWALLVALLLGAGMLVSACGDEEVPAPTTPAPAPTPAPPPPEPEPEPMGPTVPTNLRVTEKGSDFLVWSWDAVEGVLGYQGQFSPDAEFAATDPTFLVAAPQTSHKVSNLAADSTGYFRVRSGTGTSLTDLTFSDWTGSVSGTTGAAPAPEPLSAPTGIRGSDRGQDSITVTWDEVAGADTYEVEQSEDGGGWSEATCSDGGNVVETNRCIATGLTSGTSYDFRVRAVPASSATDKAASSWGTISSSVSTTGNAPIDPISGGVGDLNVRWRNSGANNADIVFIWDRQGDAEYQTYILAADTLNQSDPCADLVASDYATPSSVTSQEESTTAPGTVIGLCVRTVGGSDVSHAWGISPPEEPQVATPTVEKGKTTELTWTGVDLKTGFDYELRLAADPERPDNDNKVGSTSNVTDRAVQSACDAGAIVDQSNNLDVDLLDLAVEVDRGLNPHTGYLLCIRASNAAGSSAWAVPRTTDVADGYDTGVVQEAYTRPAAPPKPRLLSNPRSIAATSTANEKLAPSWEILTRAANNIPRDQADFNLKLFFSSASSAGSLAAADCDAGKDDYDAVELTGIDELAGFEVSVPDASAIERRSFGVKAYLCARADSNGADSDTDKGAGPWAVSSQYTVSKLSASLSSSNITDTTVDITINNWNRVWSLKVLGNICRPVTGGTTQSIASLTANTSYTFTAYDDVGCVDNELGSTSFTTLP